jgi:hypothetical protein
MTIFLSCCSSFSVLNLKDYLLTNNGIGYAKAIRDIGLIKKEMPMDFPIEQIQQMIYVIRGLKVMLDSDLAKLYGVETKVLNQSVKRNIKRFPDDFMFRLSPEEYTCLKSQFVTSNKGRGGKQKQPLVFTENGIAMLSGILNSDRAITVNISIMRIFNKLRSFYMLEKDVVRQMDKLKEDTNRIFRLVFERLDNLEEQLPEHPKDRRKIGLTGED